MCRELEQTPREHCAQSSPRCHQADKRADEDRWATNKPMWQVQGRKISVRRGAEHNGWRQVILGRSKEEEGPPERQTFEQRPCDACSAVYPRGLRVAVILSARNACNGVWLAGPERVSVHLPRLSPLEAGGTSLLGAHTALGSDQGPRAEHNSNGPPALGGRAGLHPSVSGYTGITAGPRKPKSLPGTLGGSSSLRAASASAKALKTDKPPSQRGLLLNSLLEAFMSVP